MAPNGTSSTKASGNGTSGSSGEIVPTIGRDISKNHGNSPLPYGNDGAKSEVTVECNGQQTQSKSKKRKIKQKEKKRQAQLRAKEQMENQGLSYAPLNSIEAIRDESELTPEENSGQNEPNLNIATQHENLVSPSHDYPSYLIPCTDGDNVNPAGQVHPARNTSSYIPPTARSDIVADNTHCYGSNYSMPYYNTDANIHGASQYLGAPNFAPQYNATAFNATHAAANIAPQYDTTAFNFTPAAANAPQSDATAFYSAQGGANFCLQNATRGFDSTEVPTCIAISRAPPLTPAPVHFNPQDDIRTFLDTVVPAHPAFASVLRLNLAKQPKMRPVTDDHFGEANPEILFPGCSEEGIASMASGPQTILRYKDFRTGQYINTAIDGEHADKLLFNFNRGIDGVIFRNVFNGEQVECALLCTCCFMQMDRK